MINLKKPPVKIGAFIVVLLHVVGVVGFLWEPTRMLFGTLVPANLLINAALLAIYHQGTKNKTLLFLLFIVALIGYGAEVIGVNTGLLFGQYTYSHVMGIELFGTPLLIGLLWAMLVYQLTVILGFLGRWWLIVAGAAAMVLFDVVMEPGAVRIGLWWWSDSIIPLLNYITWFLISLPLFALMTPVAGKIKNGLALTVFLTQLLFFKTLWVLM